MANDISTKNSNSITISQDALSAALAKAMQEGMTAALQSVAPAKPFDIVEYRNRPENQDPADRLKRPVFHHGQPVDIKGCSDATIENLDALESGRYLNDLVTIEVRNEGKHNEAVFIDTPFADRDRRLQFYSTVSSFSDMLQKVRAEQDARKEAKK